jgi:large subunit ribosomal protein L33
LKLDQDPVPVRGTGVLFRNSVEFTMAREYVWLECTETGMRNYRVQKETRGTERLELMKYCPKLRRHTLHKESRKK